ncbi:hypothetical protein [Oceanobacillus timonensis]|uniref:hypothetical protein n=1 Tax=Oceanobacillus timonensis TaxID=1926285 RepID=UPI0009BC428A|nr:hypothetical protein [Oceanobacillus timonensis]
MHCFLAEYAPTETTISILASTGDVNASRKVSISKASFVNDLTKEMIELSHEQGLYHHDIFAIGVVVDAKEMLERESEQLQKELVSSFRFTSVVDPDEKFVRKKLLQNAK